MPLSKYQPIGIVVLFGLLGCPSNRSEVCAPGQRSCSSAQDMAMLTTESDLAMPTSDPDLAMPADDLATPPDFSLPPPSLCPTTGLAGSRKVCNANGYCWESPLPAGRHLFAVSGRDMSNIWAVGNGGAIVKWDGTSWMGQGNCTGMALTSVWPLSANDVWAVGEKGTVLHWNGSAWSQYSIGTTADLTGVFGVDANNVWVVGRTSAVYKWNGTTWVQQNSGVSSLRAVTGLDANNIWAVGDDGAILKGDYDPPIRTYTDSRMEMSCERSACPNQVMSPFRTQPGTQIVEHETLMALMSSPGAQSATYGYRRTCKPPMGCRSMRKLPRSSNTLRSMV